MTVRLDADRDLADGTAAPRHHLVALRVENRAGVLVRIAGLFSRRGFNIVSLAVAPTDDPRFSRVSIVVDVESVPLQQILDQLAKLINVVEIKELHPFVAREAELLLVTVKVGDDERDHLDRLVSEAGGTTLDEGPGAIMVMLAGPPAVLDAFEESVRPFGIVELQRTGRIALPRLGDTS